jgi:hypothetical protein
VDDANAVVKTCLTVMFQYFLSIDEETHKQASVIVRKDRMQYIQNSKKEL